MQDDEYFQDSEIEDSLWEEDKPVLLQLRKKVREQGVDSLSIAENSRWGDLEERAMKRGEPVSPEFQAIYDEVQAQTRRL